MWLPLSRMPGFSLGLIIARQWSSQFRNSAQAEDMRFECLPNIDLMCRAAHGMMQSKGLS